METQKLLRYLQSLRENDRLNNVFLALSRAQLSLLRDQIQAPLNEYEPLLDGMEDLIELLAILVSLPEPSAD